MAASPRRTSGRPRRRAQACTGSRVGTRDRDVIIVMRSGADKAKWGHDIDDKGSDQGSDDGVASGDVARSRD